ncbi:MAG: type II CRISPR RNA-guided endonuclease Cas9 [Rhizomicrobium sp.]
MAYRLGLDIGTNSVGWTAVTIDALGRPNGVLAQGVRVFSDGRNPKDGSSLAVQRRVPRGMRRRRDRYLDRRHDLMEMLIALGLMPPDEIGRKGLETLNPYELRAKAVHAPLTPHELGRALFHLNQRRGFKSNRKTDKDADNSKIQPKIHEMKRRIGESGAKTLGEYLHRRRLKGKMVRARPEAGFYPDRALYEEEFAAIRATQGLHHALRDTQWDDLADIIFYQRPLKPVDPGWCLLENGEHRAHRALPLAQEFRMVQEANNLRILTPGEPARRLTAEQRDKVLKELRAKKELKLDAFVKLLKLPSGGRVNLLDENRKALKGDETATRLSHKDVFGKAWLAIPLKRRTEIVHALLNTEKAEDIAQIAQAQWGLNEAAARKLAAISLPDGYARLSEKAIAKLLPIMEDQALNYAEAVAEVPEYGHHSDFRPGGALDALPYYGVILTRQVVGGDATRPKDDVVAHYGRIANPTVHIGLSQLRRVVNALVDAYGKPEEIVVELARDLKMNKEEKEEERKKNRDNEAANRRREEQIRTSGGVPSAHLLRKLRLWDEQQVNAARVCLFTGAAISFEMAIDDRTEIEHILPFSKTLDDSMANKVLCLREVNRVKRDRSPFEAFQAPQQAGKYRCVYEEILFRAEALPLNKRWRFHEDAMERFANEEEFLVRQLNETKYLSRIARTYLAHLYNEKAEGKLKVRAIPGKLTAMLRGKWGLNALLGDHNRAGGDVDECPGRKNRDDHRHHAIDAFVIAMTDQWLLKAISDLNSEADRKRLIETVPAPWSGFTPGTLRPYLDRIVVSHKPDHGTFGDKSKTTGALHNDTAYGLIGPGKSAKWKVVSRRALKSVKKTEELEGIRDAALRTALETLWDEVAKAGGKPADFTKRAEEDGVTLGGRKMKVRRVRMTEELNVVQIKDRKSCKPYKAYKPDGNAFADIYRLLNGRWTAVVVQRFDANQPDFDPAKFRPHPAAKKVMRLHIDDMVALEDGGHHRILRVVKMSGQTITMADHLEGGALKARDADKSDLFKYVSKSANSLKDVGLRKVGVDEIGRLTDPGPRRPSTK